MRKMVFFLLVCLLLFSGCAGRRDFLERFAAGYCAQLEGTLYDTPFSAEVSYRPGEPYPYTLSFYAPETLSGTVLRRAQDGTLTLSSGELELPVPEEASAGFSSLLNLLPVSGRSVRVERTKEGYTRVAGEGFSLLFRSDGTPISAENGAASAKIISFSEN